jgi:hypothetical protein
MQTSNEKAAARAKRRRALMAFLVTVAGAQIGTGCASPQTTMPGSGGAGATGATGGAMSTGGTTGTGGAGAMSVGGTGGGSAGCASGLASCDGACVDFTTDPSHCGACGHACPATQGCMAGACQALPADCRQAPCPGGFYCDLGSGMCKSGCAVDADCGAGSNRTCNRSSHQCECTGAFHTCGAACQSSNDPGSCGASCTPCPTDPMGTATCSGSACGIACNAGTLMCGGRCIACSDPHGTASCSGSSCVIACQTSYNLCGGRCAAPNDITACGPSCSVCSASGANQTAVCQSGTCSAQCAAGTSICKGQCAAGTCTWTAHTSTPVITHFGIDVDGSGVIHAATTNTTWNPTYLHVTGPGAPASEVVNSQMLCWDNNTGYSAETTPVVLADGSGKASIMCVSAGVNMLQFQWSGTAWVARDIWAGSGGSSQLYQLQGAAPRFAFAFNSVGVTNSYTIYFGELPPTGTTTWTWKTITGQPEPFPILSIMGGPEGAAKIGFVSSPLATLQIATESATGFATTRQSIPTVADRYALDASGNPVGVKNLTYSRYVNGAWVNETIGTATPTAEDFVVDAAGVPRVAWIDSGGVRLATRLGSTWVTETVATGTSFALKQIDLAVGPTGKVAVAVMTSNSAFVVYE